MSPARVASAQTLSPSFRLTDPWDVAPMGAGEQTNDSFSFLFVYFASLPVRPCRWTATFEPYQRVPHPQLCSAISDVTSSFPSRSQFLSEKNVNPNSASTWIGRATSENTVIATSSLANRLSATLLCFNSIGTAGKSPFPTHRCHITSLMAHHAFRRVFTKALHATLSFPHLQLHLLPSVPGR